MAQASLPPDTPLLLLGEQHDAPEHQQLARSSVQQLAKQGRLAALVIEMAEAGRDTRHLPADATEAQVRDQLAWQSAGWPWERYGPVVMAAVQAGVPVLGGNQPRAHMRAAMQNTQLDSRLDAAGIEIQRQAIVESHCGLLPERQIPGMVRIQIARNISLADTAEQAMQKGKTVVLVAGAGHVRRDVGIPRHLSPDVARQARVIWMKAGTAPPMPAHLADGTWVTPPVPEKDHCADMRRQMGR